MSRCLAVLFLCTSFALAAEKEGVVDRARNARADGLPSAAVSELRSALAAADGNARTEIATELARCLIEADREAEAIDVLDHDEYRDSANACFWLAQAFAQNGDYENALSLYSKVSATNGSEWHDDAVYGAARMLDAMGRSRLALNGYRAIADTSRWKTSAQLGAAAILAERGRTDHALRNLRIEGDMSPREREMQRYLTGRLLLESVDYDGVREQFDGFEPRNRRLAAGAAIGEADALIQEKRPADAERRLEAFIWENPRGGMLPDLMAKLDEARARQKDPSNATLKRWENESENPMLSRLATFYLAKSDERENRADRAIRTYQEYLAGGPHTPLRFEATVRLARLLLERGDVEAAVRALDGAEKLASNRQDRAALRFLGASAFFRVGTYGPATRMFIDAANMDPAISEVALSNAALAAIRAGNDPLAAEVMNALFKEHPEIAQRVELAQALQSAALGNPDAGEQLSWIANQGGPEARAARVAAAEWRWANGDGNGARAEYMRVANGSATGGDPEQEGYFSVYLADDGTAAAVDAVAGKAREFLKENPQSDHEAEVRMKWGEVLARSGNHAEARVQFERAAAVARNPEMTQEASFLAGRAVKRSMDPGQFEDAIALFEQVATGVDPVLAEQARLEQAALRNGLGQPEEATKLLDSLISSTKDDRVRAAAKLMKARTLLSQPGESATENAIKELRSLADSKSANPSERNEALVRLAGAYAGRDDFDDAISAYYEVLNAPRDSQPEYFWYYTAGFDAGRMLGERNRFKEEAAVYEKMAKVDGPRSEEAAEKVKLLRLKNFIWED